MKFRPWGPVDWALSLSSQKQWHFAGCIGTEDRSLCSWGYLRALGVIKSEMFAEIADVDSEKYRDRIAAAILKRRSDLVLQGGNVGSVTKMELMAELFKISAFSRQAEEAAPSIILDITSFPKRFFFPMLRSLVTNNHVKNVILTYTTPMNYASDGQPLYEDIEPWKNLPGFGGPVNGSENWVVSVGFLVESLRQYVGGNPNEKMKVLIPFPAPLSVLRRTWEAVANLERDHSGERFQKFRVETLDMSAAFNRIVSIAGNPEKPLTFAPFGPKPISAAMCLYAIQKGSSVHYPQPTVYHPEYSIGIRDNDPRAAVSAYWVKHEGENLYSI